MRKPLTRFVPLLAVAIVLPSGLLAQQRAPGSKEGKGRKPARAGAKERDAKRNSNRIAIASKGMSWLTGSPGHNDQPPAGKYAQYFGDTNLRHENGGLVHGAGTGSVFFGMLTPPQREILVRTTRDQQELLDEYKRLRERVIKEFERFTYTGTEPDRALLQGLAMAYGEAEATLGLVQARAFAELEDSLTSAQRREIARFTPTSKLGEVRQPKGTEARYDGSSKRVYRDVRGLDDDQFQELGRLAIKCFAWLTNDVEAKAALPSGRPAMFFGFAAIRRGSNKTAGRGQMGHGFIDLLDDLQRLELDWAAAEVEPLVDDYFDVRRKFVEEMERLRTEGFDEKTFLELGEELGFIDVRIGLVQTRAYTAIRETLSDGQREQLVAFRSRTVIDPADLEGLSSLARGERLFVLCASCHTPRPGKPAVGPPLAGVVGRPAAAIRGYEYSPAMRARGEAGLRWTPERLDAWLAAPRRLVPGTKMGFKGLLVEEDRSAVVEYLGTLTAKGE